MTLEARARQTIDPLLMRAGCHVCSNMNKSNFEARGVPLPPKAEQFRIVSAVDRRLSLLSCVEREVDANLKRAQALWQATSATAFRSEAQQK